MRSDSRFFLKMRFVGNGILGYIDFSLILCREFDKTYSCDSWWWKNPTSFTLMKFHFLQVHVNESHEKKEKKTRSVEKSDDGSAQKKTQTEQVAERKMKQQLEEGDGFSVETTEVCVKLPSSRQNVQRTAFSCISPSRISSTRDESLTGDCNEKSCHAFRGNSHH